MEGLRAVAVAAVVLYHAHVSFLGGGYVGVDVFFVISGFLITQLLWRMREGGRRLSFGDFYARRARRLLPAAMVVLIATMAVSAHWLPPLQVRSVWKDGLASALYVGNYRFAFAQTNYLTASAPPSPFQHYWSLGVEEQFYLLWPLLIVAAAAGWTRLSGRGAGRAGRRAPYRARHLRAAGAEQVTGDPRLAVGVVLGVVTAASFAGSVWLTRADQPWAFFSLPTRAWELGVGGLLALATPWLRRLPAGLGAAIAWAGLAVIVASTVLLTATTPFPGFAALAPVGGTAAVLAGGVGRSPFGPVLLLGRGAIRFVGRISYSLYLWHWPVLILAPYVAGHSFDERGELGLVALSVALATATFLLVEDPVHHSRWLTARPGRSLALGGTVTACGVAACALAFAALPSTAGHGVAPVAALAPSSASATPSSKSSSPPPLPHDAPSTPPTTTNPVVAQLARLQSQVAATLASSAQATNVPANLEPPLADAASDEPPPSADGCLLSFTEVTSPTCLFGDTTGSTSIVLYGDSHAAMWFPAVDSYAQAHQARLYVWAKATCPPVALSMFSPALGRTFTECDEWRAGTLARIQALHPQLVVLGTAPNYDSAYQVAQDGPQWLSGLTTEISDIRQSGAAVAVVGPVPAPPADIPTCLSANLDSTQACDISPGEAHLGIGLVGYDTAGMEAEQATVQTAGASFIDVKPWFCTPTTCPVIVDNLLVFRDVSHITATYASYLAPLMTDELQLAAAR